MSAGFIGAVRSRRFTWVPWGAEMECLCRLIDSVSLAQLLRDEKKYERNRGRGEYLRTSFGSPYLE